MPKMSDANLAKIITDALCAMQDKLIELRATGRTQDQCIAPTVSLGYPELRKLTNRSRIRMAFINSLTEYLEDEGMIVEHSGVTEELIVTKPADDVVTDYNSLKELQTVLSLMQSHS